LRVALALVLALACFLGTGRSSATSVAFDLRGLSSEDYRRIDGLALERKVALRLVQEGFAVVASEREPDVLVQAHVVAEGLELRADRGQSSLRQTIRMQGPAAEWQLELAHKVSEMARTLALEARVEPAPPDRALVATPESRSAAEKTPPLPTERPPKRAVSDGVPDASWEVGFGAGVLVRQGGTDPQVGLMSTSSRGRLRLYLEVLGARSEGTGIEIWEGQGSVGLGFALVAGAVGVELGLAGGAVMQHFSVASRWASERSGTRASPAFWAPLRARWAASKRLVLTLRPALGLAKAPTHASEGEKLWSRGSLRLEVVGGLAWVF
jgi:hypothetical protein